VKHHAKASSAGSIAGRGHGHGPLRRAFATRGASAGICGSGASAHAGGLAALLLALAVVAILALAPTASAAPARSLDSSFGSFSGESPQALAVDQSNGDVYALDPAYPGKVSRYDADGNPKNFTAGPGAGTNVLTLPGTYSGTTTQVAVDSSGGSTDGNIYVTELNSEFEGAIAIFANDGTPLGELKGSGNSAGFFSEVCGVTVDQSNGDVYVGDFEGVWRYSPTGSFPTEANFSGGIDPSGISPCIVAADSGNVYAINWATGPVKRFAASDFATGTPPTPSGTEIDATGTALAVDPTSGELYVDEGDKIRVFNSSGVAQYTFGSSADFGANSAGIAVKGENGKAYVADRTNGEVDVYTIAPRSLDSSFGSFSGESPQALAVDQSNGDVYALDPAYPGKVSRYDADGNPKNFTAGPGAGTNVLTLPGTYSGTTTQVAVDSSGGSTDGNIYVTELNSEFEGAIAIFANDGTPLGELKGSGNSAGFFSEVCGVTVDQSNGDVYVGDFEGVWRYSPTGSFPTEANFSGGIDPSGISPCIVAADSGNVYAINWATGPVKRFAASDFATGTPPTPSGTEIDATGTALAVDPTSGELYVDEGDKIRVFNSSGVAQYTFGSSADFGANSAGIAVKGENGKAYVADRTNGEVDVYTPYSFASPPAAVTSSATAVGLSAATLHGKVNPRSSVVSDCHFDYVDDAAFKANGFTGAQTAPCVPDPGSGSQAVEVSAELSNLATGTTYHVRVVATNETGTTEGSAVTFTTTRIAFTDPATGTDHHTNSTVHGHIEPHGDTITNCQFDWGTTAAYGNATACAEGDSFTEPAAVSALINELTPGETIHYRLHLTTTAHGEALGADRVFTPTVAVSRPLTDTIGSAGSGTDQLSPDAAQIAVDQSSGDVYIADTGNHRVVKYDEDGNFLWAAGRDVIASGPDNVPGVNEIQKLTVGGANGGTFALEFEGSSTSPEIPFNAPASAVQAALEGLPTLDPGDVGVTGASGGPYTIEFIGARGEVSVEQIRASSEGLTAPPSSSASASIQTVQEGGAIEICRPSDTCQSGAPGSTPGQFGTPRSIAVDNSDGPSAGSVYVSDWALKSGEPNNHTITKLSPSGDVISAWGSSGQVTSISLPRGLVVDSAGDLHVVAGRISDDAIQILDGASGALIETLNEVGSSKARIAIESGGAYLEYDENFDSVQRFDPALPSGVFTNNFAISKRHAGNDMALDPASGDLYIVASSHIGFYRFDPAGNVIQSDLSACAPQTFIFGPGEGTEGCEPTETFAEGELTAATSLDVNGATRKFYVLDSGQLKIFSTFDLSPPTVTLQDASELTGTTATLSATVDPEGIELTDCHFAYVDEDEFKANGFANATDVPCSPDPGSGSGDVAVSAGLTELIPGTTYRFRIEAENATPRSAVASFDRAFTSRGPIVTSTHANPVTATDAVLRATINPQSVPTTYHFDYGPTPSYGSSTPESTPIGGDSNQAVAEKIDNLAPGTTYHFRIVAQNADATVASPDVAFTTTGAPDSCPNAALRSGFGFALPDCRAYEQASQVDKGGAHALTDDRTTAAADGNGVTWSVTAGFPTTGGGSQPTPVASRRVNGAWVTNGLIPVTEGLAVMSGVDSNLTTSFSTDSVSGDFNVGDTAAGTWTSPFSFAAEGNVEATIPAFSDDPAHFLIASKSALAAEGVFDKENLYEYDHGAVSLVSRVPVFPATSCDDEGDPVCVVAANGASAPVINTISGDGSRIVFTESGSGRIYLREGARTTQVSASQATTPDPHGHKPATLRAVSHDGSKIYFTSCEKLTDDSTAVSTLENKCAAGSDLYSYDVGSGELSDLTVDETDRIQVFDSSGAPQYSFGSAADFGPDSVGVAVKGAGGRAYVADRTHGEIDVFKQEPGARSYESSFGNGSFSVDSPRALAVDQSNGDVYAVDSDGTESIRVLRFDADGNPKNFTAGPDAGTNALSGDSFFEDGDPEIAIDSSNIAIDNSGGPADGNIYVPATATSTDPVTDVSTKSSTVAVYASDGAPLGTLDGSTPTNSFSKYNRACGVAVDQSSGDLYVGNTSGRFWRYSPSAATVTNADYSGGIVKSNGGSVCNLAADAGKVYGIPSGGGAVTRYAASDFSPRANPPKVTGTEVAANATAIATDPSSGELYVDEGDPDSADVRGVFGASPDGSDVYFTANGRLAPGAPVGNCASSSSGACELYLIHDGGDPVDLGTVSARGEENAQVIADGTLLFTSNQKLTDYDNVGPTCEFNAFSEGPGPCRELYRYRPGDPEVICVSCSPTGVPPVGPADTVGEDEAVFGQGLETPTSKRALSADGNRVFFQTADALVSRDVNGEGGCPRNNRLQLTCTDVYEWEAAGTGSCDSTAENGGCLYLISTGTSSAPAFFAAASASGDDVFIRTTDRLVPQDRDDLYDVYDARVGGGIASQHVISPPPCGGAEQCRDQGTSAPPANGAGSAAFEGPGNPPAQVKKTCPKGKQKVRRSGKTRCIKRHKHSRKHKRSQKRASANPGGSK
jgi:hypothetical protein